MQRNSIQENIRTLCARVPELESVLERLTYHGIRYGVCSGAHVAVLTGSFREKADVDIFIHQEDLGRAQEIFPEASTKLVSNGRLLSLCGGSIELMGFADFHIENEIYTFRLTDEAYERVHTYTIDSITVSFVDPADTILLKAILQRGSSEGKYDDADIQAILQTVTLDTEYLERRIKACAPYRERIEEFLAPLGVFSK